MTPLQERDKAICEAYVAGTTAERLALDYGLSVSAIRLILRTSKVKKPKLSKEQRAVVVAAKRAAPKTFGSMHEKIGTRLSHYRSFTLMLDRPATAQKLGWSTQKLASVEQGAFNLSLIDIQDLATFMKEDVSQFLNTAVAPAPPPVLALVRDPNVIDMEPTNAFSPVFRPALNK